MFGFQYLTVVYLVIASIFTPIPLIVFFSIPTLVQILPMFRKPKPDEKPEFFPNLCPNYFVAAAFQHNRRFGILFLLGLILDVVYRNIIF